MPFPPVFLTGKFHGPKSLAGYSPWGQKESDMTEHTGNLALKASEGRWAPVSAHLMSFTESPRSSALSCSKFQLLASFASTVPPPNIPSSFIILQQVHSTSPRTTGVSLGSRAPALHTKEERAQATSSATRWPVGVGRPGERTFVMRSRRVCWGQGGWLHLYPSLKHGLPDVM